jgi:GTP-binding protein
MLVRILTTRLSGSNRLWQNCQRESESADRRLHHGNGNKEASKITAIFHFEGLKRIEVPEAHAAISSVTGFEDVFIGETITDRRPPTASLCPIDPRPFRWNSPSTTPARGQEGKLVTARHIRERLIKETARTLRCVVAKPTPEYF